MKKNIVEHLYNYFNGNETMDITSLREEVNAEWARLNEKAEANKVIYNAAESIAFAAMRNKGKAMTAKEIFEASNEWPNGFTANKVQYALLHYWNDKVTKSRETEKSPFVYSVK